MSKILSCLVVVLLCAASSWASLVYECQKCHGHAGLQNHESDLWIGDSTFEVSKHRDLVCTDCHKGGVTWPHEETIEVRCDMACHAKGKDHKEVVAAENGAAHFNAAAKAGGKQSCLLCHDGAPAPSAAEAQELCLGCHLQAKRARTRFPDTEGAFGAKAHRRAAEWANVPGCVDCHGAHGIKVAQDARAACFQGGCHEGEDDSFAALFDHGPKVGEQQGGGGLLWVGLALVIGLVGLLHSVKG